MKVRMRHRVPLALPAFGRQVPDGTVTQLAPERRDARSWYEAFEQRVSRGAGYLPLYRMSDGEFVFVCGWRPYPATFLPKYPALTLKSWAKAALRKGTSQFRSGSAGYGFETYDAREWADAKRGYAQRVRSIAEEGILAINFAAHDQFPTQYVAPMCRWMERSDIPLTPANYFPFYFVYALLLGPSALSLYMGRRVLVVTSDEEGTKAKGIERSLRALGIASFQFIRISRTKAMFDRIDVRHVGDVDLVLIGAGVGALNVLEQVRPLGALSIDAGYVLDCLWQPHEFVGRRLFTLPDEGSPLLRVERDRCAT
jgi:hypothetical protein